MLFRSSLRSRPENPAKCPFLRRERNATRLPLRSRQDHLAPAPVPDSLSRIIRTIIRQGRLTTAGRTFKSETIDSWRSTENRSPAFGGAVSYKTLPYSYLRFECCTEQPLRTCHAHTCHAHTCHVHTCHAHTCHVHTCHVLTCHVLTCHAHTCHIHTCHAHARYMRQMLCMSAAQRRQMSLGVPG